MSIINDALKKAQKNLSVPETASKPLPKNIDPPSSASNLHQQPQRSSNRKKIILFFLVPIFAAFLMTFDIEFFLSPSVEQQVKQPSQSEPKNKYPTPPKKPSFNIFKQQTFTPQADNTIPKLHLSGTVMMEDQQVALINNNIYRIGDSLNDYQITEISLEGVRLQKEEETLFLKVKNYE